MKSNVLLALVLGVFNVQFSTAQMINTRMWNHLLKTYVNEVGVVNFEAWHTSPELLQTFLKEARYVAPEIIESTNDQKAYWINMYNACVVEIILNNYPVRSLEQIRDEWDRPMVYSGGIGYSLNDIRDKILRKEFADPNIHAALFSGAISSPPMHPIAFTGSNVDSELEKAMKRFLNNEMLNLLDAPVHVEVSQIFDWYRSDFGKTDQEIIDFLNRYAPIEIPAGTVVEFRPYDWRLLLGF